MRRFPMVVLAATLLGGCATFKELEPKPEVLPAERGYIELKNDKDNFELEKDGKYFIKYPAPYQDRFNLVLVTREKPALRCYLTTTFDDGKSVSAPIIDEAAAIDSIFVYAIDRRAPTFYWVIDSVSQDVVLQLRYRYVPQWRFTFENKYAEYKTVLAENIVDRSTYSSIRPGFDPDRLNLGRELSDVQQRTNRLKSMQADLVRLEAVFPPGIESSRDTAYLQYADLRTGVDDELAFQENYGSILSLFKKEQETRGNTASFLESAGYFTSIVSPRDRFPAHVRMAATQLLSGRLSEVTPYLDNLIKSKSGAGKISPAPSVDVVTGLFRACDQQMPADAESALRFISRYNTDVEGLQASKSKFEALTARFNSSSGASTESFYSDLAAKAAELKASLPASEPIRFGRYASAPCALTLGRELLAASSRADDLVKIYQTSATIAGSIGVLNWGMAETGLRELYETPAISGSPDVVAQRSTLVQQFEDAIFTGIKAASEQRIDGFIKAHQMAIDDVPELYADSAFLPVHQLSFSSLGSADLVRKRNQIQSYLDQIKHVQFPETSIRSIYADFMRNSRDRGVEKARAIVEHGKFYQGTDRQIQGLITECDVQAAKWVVRPKEYRKLFALPITTNKQGVNEYMFRIRLQIPSEAQFPVFDVNLKLPQEVAEKAGQVQWYESITIDKKPLKNEGRFRITAPTAENNYETLITPLQMDKAGRNILEVRFKYPGFKVFEVSAMAQVPIIRKN
jgi:hypothetical protein